MEGYHRLKGLLIILISLHFYGIPFYIQLFGVNNSIILDTIFLSFGHLY